MDAKEYLRSDFDVKNLKVAEIRGILSENNVHYKSNARKSELIDLFNEHIGSRSKELMKSYDETHSKPNDEGIIHVKSEGASKERQSEEIDTSHSETETESGLEENEKPESIRTPQDQKVEKTENTSPEDEIKKADDTGEQKANREGEKEHNELVAKQTDVEGSDKRKDTENTSSARERRSRSKTKESTGKHDDSVDSSKAEDKQSSQVTTPVAPKKDETPFSDENVFQSSPHSSRSKKNSAGSSKSSPAVPQKRRKDGEPLSSSKKQKVTSPLADITSKVPKKPRGHLFDDDDDDEDTSASGDDSFLKGITSQTKSPRIKKAQNKKGLQHGFVSPKPSKPSLLPVTDKVRSELRKTSKGKRESSDKITKPSSKANRKSKRVASSNNLEGRKSEDEDASVSLEKETNEFNEKLAKINKQDHEDRPTLGDELLRSPSFASKLGISVSGLAPKDYKLDEPSFVLNPKDSATNTDTDTKRPTSVPSDDELSDEEEENNAETNKVSEAVNTKVSSKRSHGKASVLSILLFVTLWLALVLLGLFGYWYREQTYLIGYCGQEIDVPTFPVSENYPNWLSAIGRFLDERYKPECTKCPSHARCYPYLEIGCYEDFVEYKPWYFDYSPVVHPEYKKCIPDTKKAEKLQIMIEVTLDLLRSRNANKNCGNTSPKNLDAGLKVEEIHELLYMMKAPYISDEEFEELWSKSLVELEKEPEIIIGYQSKSNPVNVDFNNTREEAKNKVLRSTSLSNLSIKCQLQNTIVGTIAQFKKILLAIVLTSLSALVIRIRFKKYQADQLVVRQLYKDVLDRLKNQYLISKNTQDQYPPYIAAIQLRDLILTNENNLSRKLKLWNKVSHKVENNANIRSHLTENHGEIMKVWEWITHDIN